MFMKSWALSSINCTQAFNVCDPFCAIQWSKSFNWQRAADVVARSTPEAIVDFSICHHHHRHHGGNVRCVSITGAGPF